MKKLFLLMLVMATSFAFVGCKSAEDKLREGAEEVNRTCPQQVEMGLTITRVYYDGSNIVYECIADEEYYDVYFIGLGGESVKPGMIAEIKSDADGRELVKLLKETNKGIEYRYIGDVSGEQASIVISPMNCNERKNIEINFRTRSKGAEVYFMM